MNYDVTLTFFRTCLIGALIAALILAIPVHSIIQCSFDNGGCSTCGSCNMEVTPHKSGFSWRWTSAYGDQDIPTGPAVDYTSFNPDGYLYVVDSSLGEYGATSYMQTTAQICSESACCLQFGLHMYGSSMGFLVVNLVNDIGKRFEIGRYGGQSLGNRWQVISIPVSPPGAFLIEFLAIRGRGPRSDMAIDNLSFLPGQCIIPLNYNNWIRRASNSYSCDFESSMCGFTNLELPVPFDSFQWSWQNRSSFTIATGPETPSSPTSTSFMYTESTGRYFEKASLTSVPIPISRTASPDIENSCINVAFAYSMYGQTTGRLSLFVREQMGSMLAPEMTLIFSRTGQQQPQGYWNSTVASYPVSKMNPFADSFLLIFEASSVLTPYSNIAIDDLVITFDPTCVVQDATYTSVTVPASGVTTTRTTSSWNFWAPSTTRASTTWSPFITTAGLSTSWASTTSAWVSTASTWNPWATAFTTTSNPNGSPETSTGTFTGGATTLVIGSSDAATSAPNTASGSSTTQTNSGTTRAGSTLSTTTARPGSTTRTSSNPFSSVATGGTSTTTSRSATTTTSIQGGSVTTATQSTASATSAGSSAITTRTGSSSATNSGSTTTTPRNGQTGTSTSTPRSSSTSTIQGGTIAATNAGSTSSAIFTTSRPSGTTVITSGTQPTSSSWTTSAIANTSPNSGTTARGSSTTTRPNSGSSISTSAWSSQSTTPVSTVRTTLLSSTTSWSSTTANWATTSRLPTSSWLASWTSTLSTISWTAWSTTPSSWSATPGTSSSEASTGVWGSPSGNQAPDSTSSILTTTPLSTTTVSLPTTTWSPWATFSTRRTLGTAETTTTAQNSCNNGIAVQNYYPQVESTSLAIVFPEMYFRCSGILRSWTIYVRADEAPVYLAVWRPIPGTAKFSLVGANFIIPYEGEGRRVYEIPQKDQIAVDAGDMMGYFYESRETAAGVVALSFAGPVIESPFYEGTDLTDVYIGDFDGNSLVPANTSRKFDFGAIWRRFRLTPLSAVVERSPICKNVPKVNFAVSSPREGSTVPAGAVVTYKCYNQTVIATDGYDSITCQPDGKWNRPPPACVYNYPEANCGPVGSDPSLSDGYRPLPNGVVLYISKPIECDGFITRWDYYATYFNLTSQSSVYLSVWRPFKRENSTEQRYLWVNYTKVIPDHIGAHTVILKPSEILVVKQGDILGYHHMSKFDTSIVGVNSYQNPGKFKLSELWDALTATDPIDPNIAGYQMGAGPGFYSAGWNQFVYRPKLCIPALKATISLASCVVTPSNIPNAITPPTTGAPDEVLTYSCRRGFEPKNTSGEYTATCLPNGQWSKLPALQCQYAENCVAGSVVAGLRNIPAKTALYLFPSIKFDSCDVGGYIWRWQVRALIADRSVYLSVWRPLPDDYGARLVGFNVVKPKTTAYESIEIPVGQQIFVKSGDFIGFHYDEASDNVFSVIPVSADDDTPEAFVFNLKHSDIAWSGQQLLFQDVNKIMSGSFGYKNVTGSSIIGKPLLAASVYTPECLASPSDAINGGPAKSIENKLIASYECPAGQTLLGASEVLCKPDATWGQSPMCQDIKCSSPMAPFGVVPRFTGYSFSTFFHLFMNLTVGCNGRSKQWIFYSKTAFHTIYLSIWRPQGATFQLMHTDKIWANSTGIVVYNIPEEEQIEVNADDCIGLHYSDYRTPNELYVIPIAGADEIKLGVIDKVYLTIIGMYGALNMPVAVGGRYSFIGEFQSYVLRNPALMLVAGEAPLTSPTTRRTTTTSSTTTRSTSPGETTTTTLSTRSTSPGETTTKPRPTTTTENPLACEAGYPINATQPLLQEGGSLITVYPEWKFQCSGVVKSWTSYVRIDEAPFYFSVWRQTSPKSLSLKLVGSVFIVPYSGAGLQNYTFPDPQNHISVRAGDFIGYFYESNETPTPIVAMGTVTNKTSSNLRLAINDIYLRSMKGRDAILSSKSIKFDTFLETYYPSTPFRAYVDKTATSCPAPPLVDYATLSVHDFEISYPDGFKVVYNCLPGLVMTGAANITCTNSKWVPDPPKCGYQTTASSCGPSIGGSPIPGGDDYVALPTGLVIFAFNAIECSAVITQWDYYAMYADPAKGAAVFLSVWRPISDNGRFQMVNFTKAIPQRVGLNTIILQPGQFIPVQEKDVIGYFYMTQFDYAILGGNTNASLGTASLSQLWGAYVTNRIYGLQMGAGPGEYTSVVMAVFETFALPALKAYLSIPVCPTVPPTIANARTDVKSAAVGDTAPYTCRGGFEAYSKSGNVSSFASTCSERGDWVAPRDIKCQIAESCSAGSTDVVAAIRVQQMVYMFPSLRFTGCNTGGYVWKWQFRLNNARGNIYLAVWREAPAGSVKLVGFNRYIPARYDLSGEVTFDVPANQRILVKTGDFIGFHFDGFKDATSPIALTNGTEESYSFPMTHTEILWSFGNSFSLTEVNSLFGKRNVTATTNMTGVPRLRASVTTPDCKSATPTSIAGQPAVEVNDNAFTATYKCSSGEVFGSNPAYCGIDGQWGEPPACPGPVTCSSRVPQFENVPRFTGASFSTLLHVFLNMTVGCSGYAKQWIFYSLNDVPHVIYLSVWRQVGPTLRLIATNRFWTKTKGINVFSINETEQFEVQETDVLGVHYPHVDSPRELFVIPYAGIEEFNMGLVDRLYLAIPARFDQTNMPVQPGDTFSFIGEFQSFVLRNPMLALVTGAPPANIPTTTRRTTTTLPTRSTTTRLTSTTTTRSTTSTSTTTTTTTTTTPSTTTTTECCKPCETGVDVVERYPPNEGSSLAVIFPKMAFDCPGVVRTWISYVKAEEAPVYFAVWRPTRFANRYQLVGSHMYVPNEGIGAIMYNVTQPEIVVKAGDVLGYFYDSRKIPSNVVALGFSKNFSTSLLPKSDVYVGNLGLAEIHSLSGTSTNWYTEPINFGGLIDRDRVMYLRAIVERGNYCEKPPYVEYASANVDGDDLVKIGGVVTYTCLGGRIILQGSASITCNPDRKWSAEPPVCGYKMDKASCEGFGKDPLVADYDRFPVGVIIFYNEAIKCAGSITQWHYYAVYADLQRNASAYLAVWRKRNTTIAGVQEFFLVGMTKVIPSKVGLNVHVIQPGEYIPVEVGDITGLHYMSPTDEPIIGGFTRNRLGDNTESSLWDAFVTSIIFGYQMGAGPGFYAVPETSASKIPSYGIPAYKAVISVPTCPFAPVPMTYATISYNSPAVVNNVATYKCLGGYLAASNSSSATAESVCSSKGSWTQPSVQLNCQIVETCRASSQSITTGETFNVTSLGYLFQAANFSSCASGGVLFRWRLKTIGRGKVYLAVWRPLPNGKGARLVGANEYISYFASSEEQIFVVPRSKQIVVRPGDFIGFHYDNLKTDQVLGLAPSGLTFAYLAPLTHSEILSAKGVLNYAEPTTIYSGGTAKQINLVIIGVTTNLIGGVSSPDCSATPLPAVENANPATVTPEGYSATFTCKAQDQPIGPETIYCNLDAKWSSPPVCLGSLPCFSSPARLDTAPLWLGTSFSTFMHLFFNLTTRCTGKVKQWIFYAINSPRVIYFDVWRLRNGTGTVQLINTTKVWTTRKGINYYTVPDADRFDVQEGDFLGFHYPHYAVPPELMVLPVAGDDEVRAELVDDLYLTVMSQNGKFDMPVRPGGTASFIEQFQISTIRAPALMLVVE